MQAKYLVLTAAIYILICNFTFNINQSMQTFPVITSDSNDSKKGEVHSYDNVRNKRYCEIFIVKGGLELTATVYNTLSCNDCPAEVWKAIDFDKIKDEFSARMVIANGPRYFLMDKIGQTDKEPQTVLIGGLEMKERAVIPISLSKAMSGKSKPYEENIINRSTEYVFNAGSKVYELVSPEHTYIMQSYSQIVNPELSENDLDGLQDVLKLPKGWSYKVVTLEQPLVLKTIADGEAHIIQDELKNTYQRID